MLAVPQGSQEVREGGTRHLLQAASRGAPAPGPPSSPPRGVGVGCTRAAEAPPGPRATGATVMTPHICLYESHLWARRPSPRQCPHSLPLTPRKSGVNSGGDFTFRLGGGRGCWCQLPPIRRWAPVRQRFFRPRDPGKGRNKGQLPTDPLRARPESWRPAPRGRPS